MNRHSGVAALALGAVLVATSACSAAEPDDNGNRARRTAEPNVPEVVRTSLIGVRTRDLPRLPVGSSLPTKIPDPTEMRPLLDDLPDEATYLDTYGAGDLSPDGRYWIGPTRDGVVLLDLRTGEVDLLSTPGGGRWAPGRGTIVTRRSEIGPRTGAVHHLPTGTRPLRPSVRVCVTS